MDESRKTNFAQEDIRNTRKKRELKNVFEHAKFKCRRNLKERRKRWRVGLRVRGWERIEREGDGRRVEEVV
jgi:hypothetical protein